ncbi:hypothetical protein GCM10023217_32570 [Gordonia alkaliphila]|uniref:Uncharacterized protein n=1 Tax=Gordonia alkaliphila TaxID=1053547 RepID=A0ABP8ZJC0_9ACTN
MAGSGRVGQDPCDPIAWLTCHIAVRASAIGVEDLAEYVGPVLGVDGSPGDRDAEFDGSADGVSDEASRLVHGSCGGEKFVSEPSFSHPGPAYMLWSPALVPNLTYALSDTKSPYSWRHRSA